MTGVTLSVQNADDLAAAFARFGRAAEEDIAKVLKRTGLTIRSDIQQRIQRGPKTGTTYFRIPGDGVMTVRAGAEDGPPVAVFKRSGALNLSREHTASAPGEPPATDTGRLVAGVVFTTLDKLSVQIKSTVSYAYGLEFGTRKIEPRPSWRPAINAARAQYRQGLIDALNAARARAWGGN